MKKVTLIIIGMLFSMLSFSQKTINIDTTGMSPSLKAEIEKQMKVNEITNKIETYGKWAGMGREIGIATKEGLTAVKDVAIDLSNSNLGKTVMFLIVWKVAGIDFVRIGIGILLTIIGTFLVSKSYFRMFTNRRLTSSTGFFLWRTKNYEYVDEKNKYGEYNNYANRAIAQFMHAVIWFAVLGVSALVAFI